jgi:hypothetical protein
METVPFALLHEYWRIRKHVQWHLPIMELQETRLFSIAGRFHLIQAFEFK